MPENARIKSNKILGQRPRLNSPKHHLTKLLLALLYGQSNQQETMPIRITKLHAQATIQVEAKTPANSIHPLKTRKKRLSMHPIFLVSKPNFPPKAYSAVPTWMPNSKAHVAKVHNMHNELLRQSPPPLCASCPRSSCC